MKNWKQKLDTIFVAITFAEAGEWSMAEGFMNRIRTKKEKKKTLDNRSGKRSSRRRVRLNV